MDEPKPDHRKKFQLERLILFSDAVFAIAITLLVIEIKIPEIEGEITDSAIGNSLIHLIPVFFGFIVSFFIIGIYWTVHHRLFGKLISYDMKLLWLNLLFLLSIIIMPFTSGLYGEYYQSYLMLPNIIYAINILFTGICNALLIKHISDPEKNLSDEITEKNYVKQMYARSFMMPVIFTVGLIISYLTLPWIGRMAPAFTPLYIKVIQRIFKTK